MLKRVGVYTDPAITRQYVNQMTFKAPFDSLIEVNITSGNGTLEIYKLDKTSPSSHFMISITDYSTVY